ncbi:MAG: sodium-dependent transporter [Muribaculaceae bacterium]|nr:sodium-dependent transporter [Muribaculaceae bacterium]
MSKKPQFASKLGLIAATVGSAVGLGNIWRFPAEVQANGGAAFLVLYVVCVFLVGIPVMVTEFSLGRAGQSDAVGAFKNLGAKRAWWSVGAFAILASYFILWFYMVVAGWTFEYLWQSITGGLYAHPDGVEASASLFKSKMQEFIVDGWNPLINTYVVIFINMVILIIGVQKGIERLSNLLMPLLFLILLIFCGVSLTMPDASEGLKFFLKPDISKITPSVAINALGQAFFSLSLGMGILITYSAYFPKKVNLTRTACTVSMLDLVVAILMGLIIFPAVTSFNLEGESLAGATLVFVTLPEVFSRMGGTQIWSTLFFLLLFVAALTSTISIAEVSVAFVRDRFNASRLKACLVVMLPVLAFSTLCSLSQGVLSHYKILGMNLFDFLDTMATNIMLPIVSILMCVYMGWFAPKGLMMKQLSNDNTLSSRTFSVIIFIVRYVAPLLIALVLISGFIK